MWPFSRKKTQNQIPVLNMSSPVAPPQVVQQPVVVAQPVVAQPLVEQKAPTAVVQAPSHAIDVRAEGIKSVIAAGEYFDSLE